MLLQIFKYKFLCGHMFSINLSINWRVKLLGHTVTLCLTFWGTAKLFSKVTTPFYNIPAMFKVLSSVQFSRSVTSKSLRPRALQHARPPCPSQLPEFTQTHVHWVGDTIQPPHPLSPPSPPALNLSQHQNLFKWVSSSHQVAKVLEFQLQNQFFQWIFRTDFL